MNQQDIKLLNKMKRLIKIGKKDLKKEKTEITKKIYLNYS